VIPAAFSGQKKTKIMANPTKISFGGVTPVLRVRDVEASTRYYVEKLGFTIRFQTPGFISVGRGKCCLFLCEGDQGHPGAWVWIDGVDVESVYDELRAAGAKIRHPPTNYSWALEMQVEGLDGNVLRIGSDPRAGEPDGEWLDMNGHRWLNGKRLE
jgi:catechol 2,3-dioxygenase-like lactoylglutathione lyase family enzyme